MTREAFLVRRPSSVALRAINYDRTVESLRKLASVRRVPRLRDLTTAIGKSYGSRFAGEDCDPRFGVSLLSQSALIAAEPNTRYIREDSIPRPDAHLIRPRQVLIAGAGTLGETELFGRALIADPRLVGRMMGPHIVGVDFAQPDSDEALFAYAYLSSPTGLRAIRSTACGTKILALRLDMLLDLPIPPADKPTMTLVANAVRQCVKRRGSFFDHLLTARRHFENVPGFVEALGMQNPTERKALLWSGPLPTLRAWNVAYAGRALSHLRSRWKGRLTDALESNGIFKGGRLTRIPCRPPYGVELLSQRDVFAIRPVPRRVQKPDSILAVKPSALLIASRGQIHDGTLFGRVERAAHMPGEALVTEDIVRLYPRERLSEGLFAYLSTRVGLSLIRSTAYGTSIPGIREDLLADLPIPDEHELLGATPHVEAATKARIESIAFENESVRVLEEEVLPAWLG